MAHLSVPYDPAPEVQPTGGTNARFNIQASPNAFGAQIGQALEKSGGELESLGLAQAHLTNELYANDASTQGMKTASDLWGEYGKLEGRSAVEALPKFQQDIQDNYHQTIAQAPNDAAKALLARSMKSITDQYYRYAENYSNSQWKSWADKSAIDKATEHGNQAALAVNNPPEMDAHLDAMGSEIQKLGEQKGWDPDVTSAETAKIKGKYLKDIIEQKALEDPFSAQTMFEKYAPSMDAGSRLSVMQKLHPRILDLQADQLINEQLQAPKNTGPGAKTGVSTPIANQGRSLGLEIGDHANLAPISTQSGAKFSVANKVAPQFQNFLRGLEAEGYYVDPKQSGGFNNRGISGNPFMPSQHAYGNAIDVNWTENTVRNGGKNNLPPNVAQLAEENGLTWGGNFTVKDTMHFEANRLIPQDQLPKYGAAADHVNTIERDDIGLPDKGAIEKRLMDATQGNSDLQRHVISKLNQAYARWNTESASDREILKSQLPTLTDQAMNGVEGIQFPEDKIRQVFSPTRAQLMIDEFHSAQQIGQTLRGLQWATPEEVQQAGQDLFSGRGILSDMLRNHSRGDTTGPGTYETDPDAVNESFGRLQKKAITLFQQQMQQRQNILFGDGKNEGDPGAYAALNPAVRERMLAMRAAPNDPRAFQAYAAASRAVQIRLGVPEEGVHVLTKGMAQSLVQGVTSPQASTNILQEFKGLQNRYGPFWGNAYKDMVTLGGMPTGYQSILQLDDKNASLLARALNEGNEKDNKEKFSWHKALGQTAAQASTGNIGHIIDANIDNDGKVKQFREALLNQGVDAQQADSYVHDMKTLAYARAYYPGNDTDPGKAADNAKNAFLSKYEFLNGARVPADKFSDIRRETRAIANGINENTVAVPPIYSEAFAPLPSSYADNASAGMTWVNTPDSGGLVALDHRAKIMRWKNGAPITIRFNDPQSWRRSQEANP